MWAVGEGAYARLAQKTSRYCTFYPSKKGQKGQKKHVTLLSLYCNFVLQVADQYAFIPREAVSRFLLYCTECQERGQCFVL
jgi:hypothetical protein